MNTRRNTKHTTLTTDVVEHIARGEYVRKIRTCPVCDGHGAASNFEACALCDDRGYVQQERTYMRGDYDRSTKRYELIDCDDVCRAVYVKHGTTLCVGFTY
jgi:hypothetical protein